MKSRHGLASARAIVALGFTLVFAACGNGGHDSDATASAPVAPPVAPPVAAPAEQPGVFRSLAAWAGSPDPGGAGDADGTGSAARFQRPNRLAVASDGSLWITEIDSQRVRRIDAQGRVTTVFDASTLPPRTDASGRTVSLSHPGAMVAAPSGGVFVALRQNTRASTAAAVDERWVVLRIAAGVEPQVVVQPAPAARVGSTVAGMALDRLGRLSIGDVGCAIWRSDGSVLDVAQPRGVLMLHAGDQASPGAGCSITRLTSDADDRVLFTLGSGEVRRLEPDLSVSSLGRTSLPLAYGCTDMALDRSGRLLLTGGTSALMQLDAAGREQVLAGSPQQAGWSDGPAASARFGFLCGVAVDGEGRIVVTDQIGHTVRRIAPDGSVSTVAGLAPQVGYRDGTGAQALFGEFFSVGAGVNGGVVVADPSAAVVRGVDAQQRVSTLAGVPTSDIRYGGTDGPVAAARLVQPTNALMTADGSLWIGDNTVLRRLGPDGMVRTVVAAQPVFQRVLAMALDRGGDVVVGWGTTTMVSASSSWTDHRFERYSATHPQADPVRMELVVADDLSRRLRGLPMRGTCVLPDGTLVYTQHHAVLRRAADGMVSLLAGSPDETGTQDGMAAVARFRWPSGLACDAAGGIYVADSGNHTVRYIDAQRHVRTVLGTPGRAGHRVDALPGELHGPGSLVLVPGGLVVSTGQGLVRAGF